MSDRTDPLRFEYREGPNGLRVALQSPPPGAGSFSATYVAPAGWSYDPSGSEGLARAVNQLATSGAGRFPRVELARKLDRAGAILSHDASPEAGELSIWGPADEWRPLLRLFADVVRRPRFDAPDVARVRRQMREHQLREEQQPGSRAERELLRAIFPPGHPYRETGAGTSTSLRTVTRARLLEFHRRHYVAEGALLVVTAAAPRREVEREAAARFGDATPAPAVPRAPAPRTRGPREQHVRLGGNSQVEVRLGGVSLPRASPAFPAAFLANEVLGGRPLLARLFQRVREKDGLAYHASSEIEAMRWGGYWVAQAGTGADRYRRVLPELREEVDRLREETIGEAELSTIRESAIGEIPLSLESTSDAHELAVDAAYHGLPGDHWVHWPAQLRTIRPRAVRDAAELAFDRASQATVLVGPIDRRGRR